jgi:hypothetical protein
MKNQFFYTRKERVPDPLLPVTQDLSSKPPVQTFSEKIYTDSFNIDLVIRSKELPSGQIIVLLNDLHDQYDTVPMFNKGGKPVGTRKEKATYQSEIILEVEDAERFKKATSV